MLIVTQTNFLVLLDNLEEFCSNTIFRIVCHTLSGDIQDISIEAVSLGEYKVRQSCSLHNANFILNLPSNH